MDDIGMIYGLYVVFVSTHPTTSPSPGITRKPRERQPIPPQSKTPNSSSPLSLRQKYALENRKNPEKSHGFMGRSWETMGFPMGKTMVSIHQYLIWWDIMISWGFTKGICQGDILDSVLRQVPAVDQGLSHPCWERGYSQEQKRDVWR